MEEWRDIAGTKGFIQVSNEGRVRSLLMGKPRILKTQTDNKGYHRIRVTIDRIKMTYKVHREVAKVFIDNPNNLPQVNHKDGNKSNNTVSNLEWCTNRQNAIHAIALGLYGKKNKKHEQISVYDVDYTHKKTKVNGIITGGERVWNNPNPPKAIIGYNGEEKKLFKSITEAEIFLNSRHISDVLKGKRSHVKGWTFAYMKGGDHYANLENITS